MSAFISQANLAKGLRLIDEELFPSSEGAVTTKGQHIADLAMIDAKNAMPTLNGYTSFFGVDNELSAVDLPGKAQDILGYRTLFGLGIQLAFCDDGLYVRSIAGDGATTVSEIFSGDALLINAGLNNLHINSSQDHLLSLADNEVINHLDIRFPAGVGSWLKVLSPILGLTNPWKLWTWTILHNHLYFYAKGFNRIFRVTSYEADQLVIEKLNPTYIIGEGKDYQFTLHSEDDSADVTAGALYKQVRIDLSGSVEGLRALIRTSLDGVLRTKYADEDLIGKLAANGIAALASYNSNTETDIAAQITLQGTALGIVFSHDGVATDFPHVITDNGAVTTIDLTGFKERSLSDMSLTISECSGAYAIMLANDYFDDTVTYNYTQGFGVESAVDTQLHNYYMGNLTGNTDRSILLAVIERETASNDPRLVYSLDEGAAWNLVGNAIMDAAIANSDGVNKGITWDGVYFWFTFADLTSQPEMWRSADGVIWVDMTSSLVFPVAAPTLWLDIFRLDYVEGAYYLSSINSSGGTRNVSLMWSVDCLTWNKLDDAAIANTVDQGTNFTNFFSIGGEVVVFTDTNTATYTYKHTQVDNTLTRVVAVDAGVYQWVTVIELKGTLHAFNGNSAVHPEGWYVSTDLGATWVITAEWDGAAVRIPKDNIGWFYEQPIDSSAVGVLFVDTNERVTYTTDFISFTVLGTPVVSPHIADHILLSPAFLYSPTYTAGAEDTLIYDIPTSSWDDSNDLALAIETAIQANNPCLSAALVVTTSARYERDYDITLDLSFPDPTTIPALTLTKNAAGAWAESGSSSSDNQLASIEGITSAKSRLVAWDIDNLIYWGSAKTAEAVLFTPSAETRANQLSVTSVLGKIIKCEGYSNGFIIYATGNIVRGEYVGGTTTYSFKPLKGINGVIDPRHIKATLADHFFWSNKGLHQLSAVGGDPQPAAPELTDWLANYRYPITLGLLAGRFLVLYLQDRDLEFSNRNARNGEPNRSAAKPHIPTSVLGFNPARAGINLFPSYSRALVFDTVLGRWGTADLAHKLLFSLDPVNQISHEPEKDYNLSSENLDNMQQGLGILLPDGTVCLANTFPSDSYIVFGKYSAHRDRMTKLVETIAEFASFPDATVEIEKSLDGAAVDAAQTTTSSSITELRKIEGHNMAGMWFNILIRGQYHLKRLLVKGYRYGRP